MVGQENVFLAELYFRDIGRLRSVSPNIDAIVRFRSNLTKVLLPTDAFAERPHYAQGRVQRDIRWHAPNHRESEQDPISLSGDHAKLRILYATGLRLLLHLRRIEDSYGHELPTEVVICLAAFTRADDPWTSRISLAEASSLLRAYVEMSQVEPSQFQTLLTNLLREHVKPAFVRSKNSAVTPAGRKAITALPPRLEASIDETKSKPWKYGQLYLITVFEWILGQLDVRFVITRHQ